MLESIFFTLAPYLLSRGSNRDIAGVALSGYNTMEMEVIEAMPQPQALPWARTATAGGLGLRIVCALATLATTASTGGFSSHPALWLVSCSPSRPWSCLPFPSCLELSLLITNK